MRDPTGALLYMRQIAGLVARRAVFAPRPGDSIRAGTLVGMIRLGSRIELYVPASAYRICVERGARVRAGESILGVRIQA
jgi:phosphatidylserine decarboxylase